jgi:hypothetical protein
MEENKYLGETNPLSGEKEGLGVMVWPDGSIYEGEWKNDKAGPSTSLHIKSYSVLTYISVKISNFCKRCKLGLSL